MTDWSRIVCAVDLHHDTHVLLETAVSLAAKLDAGLTLLYVIPTGEPEAIVAPPERIQGLVTEASLPMRDLAESASMALGRPVGFSVLHGQPANEIVRACREGGCNLLIVATHGRRALGRALFGSVAARVVRSAPCPVLTVRPQ